MHIVSVFRIRFLLLLAALALALGCPGRPAQSPSDSAAAARGPSLGTIDAGWKGPSAIGFRLSDAPHEELLSLPRGAQTEPMTERETEALLSRLPAPPAEQAAAFAMREGSLPTPRPGKTVETPFPPPVTTPPAAPASVGPNAGTIAAVRKQPEGDVALAPYVTVTFSEPVVPVTSQEELARWPVPVKLTPQPPGEWRWIGTQTAMFQPAASDGVSPARMPMATDYVVEIPPGQKSSSAKPIATARWNFSTPPAKLLRVLPEGDGHKLSPLVYVEFDQGVDESSLRSRLTMTAAGSVRRSVALRLASEAEISAEPLIRDLLLGAKKHRAFAFVPEQPLEVQSRYSIQVRAGLKSTEGTKLSVDSSEYSFATYGALRVSRVGCNWGRTEADCPPRSPVHIELSNDLDEDKFDARSIVVSPPIANLKVTASGRQVNLSGLTKGKATYKVTLPKGLSDVFHQTLAEDKTVEFRTAAAEPYLAREANAVAVVEPSEHPAVGIYSVNVPEVSVKVYAVNPSDYPKYLAWRHEHRFEHTQSYAPPGRLVDARTMTLASNDEFPEARVDVSPALKGGRGHAIVVVEIEPGVWKRISSELSLSSTPPRMVVWTQVTALGLNAARDSEGALVWVTDLATGKPVQGARVGWGGSPAETNREGVARTRPGTGAEASNAVLMAQYGNDSAFFAEQYMNVDIRTSRGPRERFFVFDDRKTYKPGERAMLKGWVRSVDDSALGDVSRTTWAGRRISYRVKDAQEAEIAKGSFLIDERGEFDTAVELPKQANLGRVSIWANTPDGRDVSLHELQLQEFRTPEFEVTTTAPSGPFYAGMNAVVSTKAAYYAGGGLPNADIHWRATRTVGHFTPPNRSDYLFGKQEYFWHGSDEYAGDSASADWSGTTDAQGVHRVRVDFDGTVAAYPMVITTHGTVTDVNRQAWSSSATMLVHPANVSAGVKLKKSFVRAGEALPVELIASDIDGALIAGRTLKVRLGRVDEARSVRRRHREGRGGDDGAYVEVASCEVTTASAPSECTLIAKQAGRHRLTATVTDAEGRKSETRLSIWVLGDTPADSTVETERLTLVADKKEYQPGDTAELLITSPVVPAEGWLTVRRGGVLDTQRFSLASSVQTVKVRIPDRSFPNLHVHAVVVGRAAREPFSEASDRHRGSRPAEAQGDVMLSVPPTNRTLTVTATPRSQAVEPGGSTAVDVTVKDAQGAPVVDGSVTVVVVDEAILALGDVKTPNPLHVFYTDRGAQTSDYGTRSVVSLTDAARPYDGGEAGVAEVHGPHYLWGAHVAEAMAPAPTMAKAALAAGLKAPPPSGRAIAVRSDFSPLALFYPAGRTNRQGMLSVSVKVPDNVTRYRIMAVASSGEQRFGAGESALVARLPLIVRPSAPRFLNYGDRFELPVVIQNQTGADADVNVAVRASNADIDKLGKKVRVPAGDRVEVRFSAAARSPGKARFQVAATSGAFHDASDVSLPVWTPATTEAFATYGVVDGGAVAQPIKRPPSVVTSEGGLEVSTSATALSGLTDAVLYLVRYPYDCNEQVASRLISIAGLKDVLGAFSAADMPSQTELVASVAEDIATLRTRQDGSGGWGFWGRDPWPYLSIHVTHALARARNKGFSVPKPTLDRAQQYLRQIDQHIPPFYAEAPRRALQAYALYTRRILGDADSKRARELFRQAGSPERLGLEAIGWLLPTLHGDTHPDSEAAYQALRAHLANRVTEQAGAAHFASGYGESDYLLLASDRRADAILLEALIDTDSKSELIPKLVTGLLAHRKAGKWSSTQENAFVLLALDRYFGAYERVTPDFVARAWLGDKLASEHAFRGRSTERQLTRVPMSFLPPGDSSLVLGKDGPGRMYFRIGMNVVPETLNPAPIDRGFVVSRRYEATGHPDEVRKDESGAWHIKAGATVRTRVTMVAPSRRYHVALVDALPAGFEPMNPALKGTGPIPRDARPGRDGWWMRTWYEHDNLRDDRAEAFSSLVWEGVHEYVYTSRATTPGSFVVPPPKAEEMYSPEVFGRGAGDRVIVE